MRQESRLSRVVPYSKAKGPPEFSATLPPMVEAVLEAGSTVKSRPSFAVRSMASWVMTPAWQFRVRCSLSTVMAVSRVMFTITLRLSMGTAPPVMPEPPPRGMRANFISLARRTSALTCSVVAGSTTRRGSSMRRSVASVAHSTRDPGRVSTHSSGITVFRRSTSSCRKRRSAS